MSADMTPELEAELKRIVDSAPPKKFNAPILARELIDETPIARGGGELFVYRDGHYRPGGRDELRERIVQRLGNDWKRFRSDEVMAYIAHSAPKLLDEPPPNKINLANGILDLDTGDLETHDPVFLSPIQIPVTYDPDADCPAIQKFLEDVLHQELIDVFYELAGYLVVPDNSLQIAVMLLGSGANGKSTALNLLTRLIGQPNVSSVALHRLDEDRFSVAELYGKLANIFADLDARALQSSSVFKSITGGDLITGERKHQDPFSWRPYARLLFSANEPPPTPDNSDAFFRRWLILPFEKSFRGKRADRNLIGRLTTEDELSGLLNQGLARLTGLRRRGGFTETSAARKAAERFRIDADSVAGFLAESCRVGPDERVRQPDLYPAYKNWTHDANRRPVSRQRFNRRLAELAPTLATVKVQGVRYWDGISLEIDR